MSDSSHHGCATGISSQEDVAATALTDFRIARTLDDREAAFRLLYRSYLRAELAEPNDHGLRVSPFHLLPESTIFVAEFENEIISTVSMVQDGALGLPIEAMYPECLQKLRKFGTRCAEICCLADRRSSPERGIENLIEMTRLALFYAMQHGVDCLLVIAHPRHAKFYKRAMGFKAIDEIRSCPFVRNRPAEPLLLNLVELQHHRPRLYDRYFHEPVAPERLLHEPISADQIAYFSQFLDRASLVHSGHTSGSCPPAK